MMTKGDKRLNGCMSEKKVANSRAYGIEQSQLRSPAQEPAKYTPKDIKGLARRRLLASP